MMLFNPKWETKADPFSLASVIAWLETKDPSEQYNYWSLDECLIAQYLRDHRVHSPIFLSGAYQKVAACLRGTEIFYPSTFGEALARLRAA